MANKISRRTFVKGLAAGAASVAALGVLGSVEMKYSAEGSDAGSGAEPFRCQQEICLIHREPILQVQRELPVT